MRHQGPYKTKFVPSFADLAGDSTTDRQAALLQLVAAVTSACVNYDAATPDVDSLTAIALTKAQQKALIDGYDGRTVAIKRRLAKMIQTLPEANADLCPYCSLDTNPDLDHFLPKVVFPEFSLHARNLVPICTPCNRKKLNAIRDKVTGARLFLHPSAEPSGSARLLEADLNFEARRITVNYRIDDQGVLSPAELALVVRHYGRLGLGDRYGRRARSHLAAVKKDVKHWPVTVVARTLKSKIQDSAVGEPLNGWRPALYRAVAAREPEVLAWLTN